MDRLRLPRVLWGVALVLLAPAAALAFGNALHGPLAGRNEEAGAVMGFAGVGLVVAGLLARGDLEGWDARAAAAFLGLLILGTLALALLVPLAGA